MKVSAANPVAALGSPREVRKPEPLRATPPRKRYTRPDDFVTISPAGRAAAKYGDRDAGEKGD